MGDRHVGESAVRFQGEWQQFGFATDEEGKPVSRPNSMKHTSKVTGWILGLVLLCSAPAAGFAQEPAHGGAVPSAQMEYRTPEAKKLIARIESGDAEGARKELKKLLRRQPDNLELWMIEGLLLAGDGDYAAAIAALEKGVRGKDTDLPFLVMQARIHEDRAELGPDGSRRNGMVQYKAAKRSEAERAAFVTTEKGAAATCYQRALRLLPMHRGFQARHAALLRESGDARGALTAASGYVKQSPADAELWLQVAKSAMAAEAWPEARAAADRCVELRGSLAEACGILAQLESRDGRSESAAEWDRQARFHAFVPPFLHVEYNPENFARIEPLLAGDSEQAAEAEQEQWRQKAVAAIDALIREKSDTSSRLLGIIAWGHNWHGEVEDRIYAELEARQDEGVLMALFDRAGSYCTVGSAAPALARLKSKVAFPLIIERLPQDQNMFPMQLPESLAIYGHVEAVAPLGSALQEAIEADARSGLSVHDMMGGVGTRIFIDRCIWALAAFNTPEARGYLEETAKHQEHQLEATAALFKQTGEPAHFQRLLSFLATHPDAAADIAQRYQAAQLPEAVTVEKIAQAAAAPKEAAKK
jgi:tetratricopeptide (TPR) repeat protein